MWKHSAAGLSKEEKDRLTIEFANSTINYKWPIRTTADNHVYSKSTVHRWLNTRLKYLDYDLYRQVRDILQSHKGGRYR